MSRRSLTLPSIDGCSIEGKSIDFASIDSCIALFVIGLSLNLLVFVDLYLYGDRFFLAKLPKVALWATCIIQYGFYHHLRKEKL